MIVRPFNVHLVLEERIHEAKLRAYDAGFEQNRFRLKPLVNVILDVVPEYVMGYHAGATVPVEEIRRLLREAAKRVYTTDKYGQRGEFGELILHLLLRGFCGSVPLVSKIWFKDTDNVTVHGFDAVHVVEENGIKRLWLGESKIYTNARQGIRSLVADLSSHLEADYLKREFNLICSKIPADSPDILYWRNLLNEYNTLEAIFESICIPMACTYTSEIYSKYSDASTSFISDFQTECRKLDAYFLNLKPSTNVDILLLLLPVQSKSELVRELDAGLKQLQ